MSFLNEQAIRMNYILALYDNTVTSEIRNQLIPYINNIEDDMKLLNDIMSVFRTKLLNHDIVPSEALEIIDFEYRSLDLDRFLVFDYIEEIILFSLYMFHMDGYDGNSMRNMIHSIIDKADMIQDVDLRTDLYCCAIKILSTFELVVDEFDLTRTVMNYYNSLPEENRKIKILPDALTAF